MGKIMIDADTQFFELPGIQNEIESLNRQLDTFRNYLDHIVIKGPKGVGKSQFVQIAKERLWNYKAEDAEFKTIDCESITKEELVDWKSFPANGNELIILENLECFPVEEFKTLSALLKRVRVVATTRSDLPDEFTDNFTISIEVPPLYKRRDDIFHFIAWKYPSIFLTNVDLVRLYAYHWPGNFPELDRAIGRLKAEHKFPPDIERYIAEEKLCALFNRMYDSGLPLSALFLAHGTCFSRLIPTGDSGTVFSETVEIRFENNDNSSDIDVLIEPTFLNLVLNGQEVRWIFKCFFNLIYGRGVTFSNQNIFDLQPFTAESLKFVMQAQKDVFQWKIGDVYSSDYDLNHIYFQHFSKSLKQEEIDAAVLYLKSCLSACEAACPVVCVESPTKITLKKAMTEGNLDEYDLFEQAEKGIDHLELLLYVRYEDIVKAASLPDLTSSKDFGDYLVIPHYCITTLTEHNELEIQDFLLSKVYPRSPGLLSIIMLLAGEEREAISTLRTVKPYTLKLSECFDRIKVVRQQAEKFYKKATEAEPLSITQGAPADSGQVTDHGSPQSPINQQVVLIQSKDHAEINTNVQNIDNSVSINSSKTNINTNSNTTPTEKQNQKPESPEQQDNLSEPLKAEDKTHKGIAECMAAFASFGRKVTWRRIRQYRDEGILVIENHPNGNKTQPWIKASDIQACSYTLHLKESKKK